MAKRTLYQQLDEALQAMIATPDAPAPAAGPRLSALLKLAADLRDLPRPEFKARLAQELARGRVARRRVGGKRRAAEAAAATTQKFPATATAIPCLVVRGGARAIDFYQRAFDAKELDRVEEPGTGKLWHAEIAIGSSRVALSDEFPEHNLSPESVGGTPVIMSLDVNDADAVVDRAVNLGARIVIPVANHFYGQRGGRIADPFGHLWIVSSKVEDLSPDEMRRRAVEFAAATQSQEHGGATEQISEKERAMRPRSIPEGFHSITPFLHVRDIRSTLDFIERTFGAERLMLTEGDEPPHSHAEVRIGDSIVMLGSEVDEYEVRPTPLHVYMDDVDAIYRRALQADAEEVRPPVEQDYGDREVYIKDRAGNHWYVATHRKDAEPLPPEIRTVNAFLHPERCGPVIDFLKQAFGADEVFRGESADGTVYHAKVRIGDSIVEMGDAHGEWQPMPMAFYLYVEDADQTYRSALRAGAVSIEEPVDKQWGDRCAAVRDPFDDIWFIATHKTAGGTTEAARRPEAPAVIPFLYVPDVPLALDFYRRVLGAEQLVREAGPDGRITFAQMEVGEARFMLRDPSSPELAETVARGFVGTPRKLGGTPVLLYLYVEDVDAVFKRAVAAGAVEVDPLEEKEWGDRSGAFQDPFGHVWSVATPIRNRN